MTLKSQKEYSVKHKLEDGVCRIVEDDTPCTSKVHDRGVCQRHRMALERRGLLETFAAKSQKLEHTFEIKLKLVEGVCSIVEDGEPCQNAVDKRGLCSKHASRFYRDGTYEQFAAKSGSGTTPVSMDLELPSISVLGSSISMSLHWSERHLIRQVLNQRAWRLRSPKVWR